MDPRTVWELTFSYQTYHIISAEGMVANSPSCYNEHCALTPTLCFKFVCPTLYVAAGIAQ